MISSTSKTFEVAVNKLVDEYILEDKSKRKLYQPSEVMEMFNITWPTFTSWCKKGVLKRIEIPGHRRIYVSAESVDKLINP